MNIQNLENQNISQLHTNHHPPTHPQQRLLHRSRLALRSTDLVPWLPLQTYGLPCRNLSQDQKRETCRMNGDVDPLVGDNDYAIDCDVTLGNCLTDSEWPKENPRVEITSAGPGSHDGLCCGFTVSVNIKDGTLHMESEDWSHASGKEGHSTGTTFCDDSKSGKKCSSVGSISGGQQLFGKTIHIHWDVRRDGSGNLYYTGEATGPGNKKVSKTIMNPTSPGTGGKPIIPGHGIGGYFSNSFILSSLGFVSRVQQTTA